MPHPFLEAAARGAVLADGAMGTLLRARGWHTHDPATPPTVRAHGGLPLRTDPEKPWTYERKPLVAISFREARDFCAALGGPDGVCRLPTEAEWERAARGGLIGGRYPWGSDAPSPALCDFNRFDEHSIRPVRAFPPNGYGLYAMCGTVWEWTGDYYDRDYYAASPRRNPPGPDDGCARVVRGGSWSDCAAAVTVSFRSTGQPDDRRQSLNERSANVGLRVCRVRSRRPRVSP